MIRLYLKNGARHALVKAARPASYSSYPSEIAGPISLSVSLNMNSFQNLNTLQSSQRKE
jgi:hypothetical protein